MRYKETRYKETRYKETRYKDENLPGNLPESGAIFMSNSETKRECLDRKLFGLPYNSADFVLSVKKGMLLFLFEFENRLLYGVFRATCDGEINIQPGAYRKKFPAQVRFTTVWDRSPLAEHEFRDAIKDNYYSMNKFNFGLNQDQVDNLMTLFRSKKTSKNPEKNVWRRGDEPAEGHARFGGDLRRTIVDRLRVTSKEDDDINSNDEKIVEVDKVSFGRRDRFKKNHLRENDDFCDSGSRKKLPGNHLDHSLVGLKREVEVGSHYMVDENKGLEFNNNHREFRGLTNEDNFSMMEKTKVKNNLEDYIPLYTEPPEEHYDEIGLASNDAKFLMDSEDKDIMDYNRLRDEYIVRKDYRQSLSANYLGRSCDVGSRRITDNDALETELRTLNEQSLSKRFVDVSSSHMNQDTFWTACDPTIPYIPLNSSYLTSDPSFIPLESRPMYPHTDEITPSFHSHNQDSIQYFEENRVSKAFSREGSLNSIIPKFTSLGSKKVGADGNYTEGHKAHAFSSGITPFAASKTFSREGSLNPIIPKFTSLGSKKVGADENYTEGHKAHAFSSGVTPFAALKTFSREGSLNLILPKFTSLGSKKVGADENHTEGHKSHAFSSGITPFAAYKDSYHEEPTSKFVKEVTEPSYALKRPSSDADLCVHKEDSKRVSVFARLNSDSKHEQEPETVKKNVLNASVDEVMKMLEKVASNPSNETVKIKSVNTLDDDDITPTCEIADNKVSDSVIDLDADLAAESIEDELVVKETRVVDFKRRKKTNKGNTECLGGATSDSSCKRRKLVRPAFVKKESTGDGAGATKNMGKPCEITPFKDKSCPLKVVVESKEQVGEKESTGDGISATENTIMLCEITPSKVESCSTKVVVESKEQVGEKELKGDGISATKNTNMLCEVTPFKGESCSTKVIVESKEQVDEKELTGGGISATKDTNMLCEEITPFKGESCLAKVVVESKEQVDEKELTGDGISATKDTNMLCEEITPFKGESWSAKVVVESKEQVDEKQSTSDDISDTKNTNMLCEITPFKEESCSMKVVVESKEQVDERESTGEGISTTNNKDTLCEVTPSKDESNSMKVVAESNEQVNEFIKPVDIMPPYEITVLPAFNENTLFKDDVTSAECQRIVHEGKECSIAERDGNAKIVLRNDDYSSTKAIVERCEKNDGPIKLVQMSNDCQKSVREEEERSQFEDGNVENKSCNDDSSWTEVVVERSEKVDAAIKPVLTPGECQKNVGEGEKRSQIEDQNAATRLVSDVFVEVAQVSSSKDDHKMCGWIFE